MIDQVGRRGAGLAGIKPHVERPVVREAETSPRPGKLVRRQPQIQKHPLHPIDPQVVQHRLISG